MSDPGSWSRRQFVKAAGAAAAASVFPAAPLAAIPAQPKRRYAIVGTGDRGTGMWGAQLVERYQDILEFVGLCDINPKRAAVARELVGVDVPDVHELRPDVRSGRSPTWSWSPPLTASTPSTSSTH